MSIHCSWLPPIRSVDPNNIENEIEIAYKIFCNDFILSCPKFNGFDVSIRRYTDDSREKYYTFNHIITKDYNGLQQNSNRIYDRSPDIRRIERIEWVRKIIEHSNCSPTSDCNCRGVMTWYEEHKPTYRVNIMLYEENFLVVLEKNKKGYYLLITAFYLNNNIERNKRLSKFRKSTFIPYPI